MSRRETKVEIFIDAKDSLITMNFFLNCFEDGRLDKVKLSKVMQEHFPHASPWELVDQLSNLITLLGNKNLELETQIAEHCLLNGTTTDPR